MDVERSERSATENVGSETLLRASRQFLFFRALLDLVRPFFNQPDDYLNFERLIHIVELLASHLVPALSRPHRVAWKATASRWANHGLSGTPLRKSCLGSAHKQRAQ